jgi:hypothetical protein
MEDCKHEDTWFDRSICYCTPKGTMHDVCSDCGYTLDDDGFCSDGEQ